MHRWSYLWSALCQMLWPVEGGHTGLPAPAEHQVNSGGQGRVAGLKKFDKYFTVFWPEPGVRATWVCLAFKI